MCLYGAPLLDPKSRYSVGSSVSRTILLVVPSPPRCITISQASHERTLTRIKPSISGSPQGSDASMIIPLEPRLEGLAERRFFSFAQQVLDRQSGGDLGSISALVEGETIAASNLSDLGGQCEKYAACVRVLGDLAQLRWKLVESGYGLELHSPRPQDGRISDPAQSLRRKEAIRNELRPRVLQQFSDANVRKFIQRMERPPRSLKQKSIRTLIADGSELRQRLRDACKRGADDPAQAEMLRSAVQPYLQLVDSDRRTTTRVYACATSGAIAGTHGRYRKLLSLDAPSFISCGMPPIRTTRSSASPH